jgi:hypothetical protein
MEKSNLAVIPEEALAHKTTPRRSPAQYRRFLKPFQREIVKTAHSESVPTIKRTDGNI